MNKVPMTMEGANILKKELGLLKMERHEISETIATARELGDLKENAEYHAARERQSFNEGRIQEIEGKISNAQIVDITAIPNRGRVIFGVTVKLINLDTKEERTLKIVGEDEADITKNKISINSPIVRGLIGHSVGDESVIETPTGLVSYSISEIEHL